MICGRLHGLAAAAAEITSVPSPYPPTISSYLSLLTACRNLRSLLQVHGRLIVLGLKADEEPITAQLINSYSLLHKLDFARSVFDSVPEPGVVSWNSMIRTYTTGRQHREALELYSCMLEKGIEPDKYSFTFVLKACAGALDLQEGITIHRRIADMGFESDVYIGTALVDMYGKIGDLRSARQVFDKMPKKDIVTWNAMISGLAQNAYPHEALGLFRDMQMDRVEIDYVTLFNLIPAVSKLGDNDVCRSIHGYVIKRYFNSAVYNGLIDMYCKCADVYAAKYIFDGMLDRNDVSWGTMIGGYALNGCFVEVLELFDCLKNENVKMNKVAAASALLAASKLGCLEKGRMIHEYVMQQGINKDVSVATSIITMYAKCGELEKAKQLFTTIKERDVVVWSAIISACEQAGYPEEALSLFRSMMNEYVKPNDVTLVGVLPACAELSSLRLGKSIHCYAMKANIDSYMATATAILSMYAKCGFFGSALFIFGRMPSKDVIAWNALINGYSQTGNSHSAIEMFNNLKLCGVRPDPGTMVGLLSVCALFNDIYQGSCLHGQIIKYGFNSDCHVEHALIDLYTKCGNLASALFLFNRSEFKKTTVSWNVMITGYLLNAQDEEAIFAFRQMKLENFQSNVVTFVSVLPAAAHLTALGEGMSVHACVIRMGFQSYTAVGNSLIDMYAKCGRLEYAEKCFNEMRNDKNTVSWNIMLAGYAVHGLGHCAVSLLSIMQEKGVEVDSVSFLNVLSACRHAGLVEEGKRLFNSMYEKHNLEADSEHYACMVDLLGRAGLFDEALGLIRKMPMRPDAGVWGAVLSSSQMHSSLQLSETVLSQLIKLEPGNPVHYAVLSSIYARDGRWDEAGNKKSGVKRIPGCSWIEV